jgi:hypothetical protein
MWLRLIVLIGADQRIWSGAGRKPESFTGCVYDVILVPCGILFGACRVQGVCELVLRLERMASGQHSDGSSTRSSASRSRGGRPVPLHAQDPPWAPCPWRPRPARDRHNSLLVLCRVPDNSRGRCLSCTPAHTLTSLARAQVRAPDGPACARLSSAVAKPLLPEPVACPADESRANRAASARSMLMRTEQGEQSCLGTQHAGAAELAARCRLGCLSVPQHARPSGYPSQPGWTLQPAGSLLLARGCPSDSIRVRPGPVSAVSQRPGTLWDAERMSDTTGSTRMAVRGYVPMGTYWRNRPFSCGGGGGVRLLQSALCSSRLIVIHCISKMVSLGRCDENSNSLMFSPFIEQRLYIRLFMRLSAVKGGSSGLSRMMDAMSQYSIRDL